MPYFESTIRYTNCTGKLVHYKKSRKRLCVCVSVRYAFFKTLFSRTIIARLMKFSSLIRKVCVYNRLDFGTDRKILKGGFGGPKWGVQL